MSVQSPERPAEYLSSIPELDYASFERAIEDTSDISQQRSVLTLTRSIGKDEKVTFNAVHSNGTDGNFKHEDPTLLAGRKYVHDAVIIASSLDALTVSNAKPIEPLHNRIGDWEYDDGVRSEIEEELIAISALTDLAGQARARAIDEWLGKAWSLDFDRLNKHIEEDPDLSLRLHNVDPDNGGDQVITAVRLVGFGMKELSDPQYSEFSDLDLVVPVPILQNKFSALGSRPPKTVVVGLYAKQHESKE